MKDINISKSELESIIDEWIIGKNSQRNRNIIRRRLFDGITYEKIAEEFSMSVRQTKEIVYRGEQIILRHIDK